MAVANAADINATTYTSRWRVVVLGNCALNGSVSRNAKRICTPVCATRSSWSRSAKLRSQRCFSVSLVTTSAQLPLGCAGQTLSMIRARITSDSASGASSGIQ